jgi:hypothetical protein
MKPVSVLLSPATHLRLNRISKQSRLSPTTIIRHAVKKQLPIWEGDGDESKALASKAIYKLNALGTRQKIKSGKPNTPKL